MFAGVLATPLASLVCPQTSVTQVFFHTIADFSKMFHDRHIELYGILEAVTAILNKHRHR